MVPALGRLLSGHKEGYRYLGDSLLRFPSASHLAETLRGIGFREVRVHRLFFGAAALHEAVK